MVRGLLRPVKILLPFLSAILGACFLASPAPAAGFTLPMKTVESIFAGREGTLVVIDCDDRTTSSYTPSVAQEKFAPCSTFKIWNTLIGLEEGIISSAEEPFYTWDGEKRFIPDWNKNLNLKQAFQVSCVPAFQELARKIGPERMQAGLDAIGYGDRNISAGIDVFWLPEPGRKTILISPLEQAELIGKLATGKLSFAQKSQDVLREIMTTRTTLRGTLFGKTGSSGNNVTGSPIGWYVGYIETNGKTYAFACLLKGKDVMGKDARAIVEAVAEKEGWL
jgi:beta-lactamase class D